MYHICCLFCLQFIKNPPWQPRSLDPRAWQHGPLPQVAYKNKHSKVLGRYQWHGLFFFVEFNGILAFRQQHEHPDACGRSDLFYVCLLTPITFDLNPCKVEIAVCKWMSVDDLELTGRVSAISKRCLQLVRHGLKNGFEKVTIHAEECKSIYKDKRMTLFSRSLDMEEDLDLGEYPHHITTGDQFDWPDYESLFSAEVIQAATYIELACIGVSSGQVFIYGSN